MKVDIKEKRTKLLTYKIGRPNEAPYFIEKKQYQGASGKVYPLKMTDQLTSTVEEKEYTMVLLENEYIRVELLPEIGGKIYGAVCKYNNYEFIYRNTVVKPALIGLCGPWVSGGVEFNWPQHHRPTTFQPVEYEMKCNKDGSCTCFMGEVEPFHRMRGMVAVTVYPTSTAIEVRTTVTNTNDQAVPFMWWNNTAVRVNEQYKCIFPPDVQYGSDHDRRDIIPFPVMKGEFKTAHPYNYGTGVDASWYKNVKVQTSVMIPKHQSDMDFVGGYDYSKEAGTAIIGDHYIAPGKKMFTWANCDFGKQWCRNLTDNDDRYIELMTGAYTDNQPDFTYIEPGETKVFTQYWYPIQGIGNISNANKYGALVLEKEGGKVKIGAVSSGVKKAASMILYYQNREIYRKEGILSPDDFWLETITIAPEAELNHLLLQLNDNKGQKLVDYTSASQEEKEKPQAREISPRPKDIESLEELYLHGIHLLQYKHGTYVAEDYFAEALKRDSTDYRCNLEMGKLLLEKGEFENSEHFLKNALARLTIRNANPHDTEVLYELGRLYKYLDLPDQAYRYFKDAAWQYAYTAPANFECACISMQRNDTETAVEELNKALEANPRHYKALALLSYIKGDSKCLQQIFAEFPQESYNRYSLYLLTGEKPQAFLLHHPQDVIDVALLFKQAGLEEEAARILKTCDKHSPMLSYHLSVITGEKINPDVNATYEVDFPNRLEDIPVLVEKDWYANYLLGCLYYDRENYRKACKAFISSICVNPGFAYTHRNLAFLYYDHLHSAAQAMAEMEKAVELKPEESRFIYEMMMLQKMENVSPVRRLEFAETHIKQIQERDDAYLETIILYMETGDYKKAEILLENKNFHIYEGGEGKLTKNHRWLYILEAIRLCETTHYKAALKKMSAALIYPKNYGESESIYKQNSNVHYIKGCILEKLNRQKDANAEFQLAENEKEILGENMFYVARCLGKTGYHERALTLYQQLIEDGRDKLKNQDLYGYFGVGLENPLPFELNIVRRNKINGLSECLLGYYGADMLKEYQEVRRELSQLDPYNTLMHNFDKVIDFEKF
ncbi:DUF5107 domain-containing protein [Blautia liquoris]|uniref:DUF5107 domain-containing protein n=1 Tax=Blautia liquoris TaxID=2779518 RepID=A0A7M2REF5_9FIRM|nr:DUF5107 domain-containing protein [Blautia liquoris]QOV18696.1 DUF5107 domain-containing protein [Blautia liquoris]